MLSVRAFSSASAASGYYSHGDYYGSEGEGMWLGKGAEELGLSGEFTAKNDEKFNNLLKGVLPDGQILGKKTKEGIEHRPGIDLTFSCPKSFSIQMLLNSGTDQKSDMNKALMKAVGNTLSYIEEQGYAFVRKGKAGIEKEPVNKLAFATFTHTTNRNLEPQAHVHCFLANAAKCKDGKYRSLTFDKILENNKFFGQIFRNELALETKKLGLEIIPTTLSDGSSSFEITNISSKLMKAFSTRRQEIEELCKLYGVTSKEGRDKIVINSRKAKTLVTEDKLHETWRKVEKNVNLELSKENSNTFEVNEPTGKTEKETIAKVSEKISQKLLSFKSLFTKENEAITKNESNDLSAKEITLLSIEDLNSSKTVFSQEELLKKTLKFSIGNYSIKEVSNEVKALEKLGELIRHENYFTTKTMLDKEKQILKYAKASLGVSNEIIKDKHFDANCSKFIKRELSKDPDFQINEQQINALKHILTSKDKIITMEGLPGVGKSTVLNGVRDISGRKIISLLGFGEDYKGSAPTASAAKTLEKSAKVESSTLHSFLGKYQGYIEDRGTKESLQFKRQELKKTVIFLDEGSLVSTNIMHKLLKLQEKFGFRLVLTGDIKQMASVEAGKPFEQILQVVKPVIINEIVRQKSQKHKDAVIASSNSNIKESFAIHIDNIHEKSSLIKIAKEATKLFLEKDKSERDKTLLISPTRKLRDKINDNIRMALSKENSLTGIEKELDTLKQKDLTTADYRFASSYQSGDVIKFNTKYKNGIEKGDYLTVKTANAITNSLLIEKNGKDLIFNLKKSTDYQNKLEVFEKNNLKLQEGLKIIFTKNNKELGLTNSETAIVQNLNDKQTTLKLENGTIKTIPNKVLKHIDYGYCVTIHTSQGKTFDNTIAAISNNKLLNNQKSWLVAISRHRKEFTAIVENKEKLETYLIKNKGKESSAMELVSQLNAPQNTTSNSLQTSPNDGKITPINNKQLQI